MKRWVKTVALGALAMSLASPAFAAKMIQVKGSDTLINLVQRLAEVYMEENPGKMIAVTGGGSGTGVAALINRKCDIANASRQMKDKEIALAVQAGVEPKRVVVAIDGLCVIVSSRNPVKKLTVEQIGKIYKGQITNWKEVGGSDSPITLYGRQPNSGTYDFLKEVVLKGEYSPKMNQMNGNAQIVEAVKQDSSGIGYVGIGYVQGATDIVALEVASRAGAEYYDPLNTEHVRTGQYPITRPLNQYLAGMPQGDIKDFIAFELSPAGQKIVEEEGFLPLNEEYVQYNKMTITE